VQQALGSERDALAQQLAETKAAQASAQADALDEAEDRIQRLSETLEAERQARSELAERAQQTQTEMQTRLAEAEQALGELQQMLSTRDESHQSTTAEYEAQLAEAEAALEAMRDKIQEREAALEQARRQAEALRTDVAEQTSERVHDFYERFAALDAQLTARGLMVNLSGDQIRFPSGSASLPDDATPLLEQVAAVLIEYPQLVVQVQGHTDSSGNTEINRALSEQRAEAVREALVELGVAPGRLKTDGLGSEQPIASNATADGRQRNRRVELYIERRGDAG
jgi:outer membrane protein OmpA-like peptidoglycan-associated protein